MGVEFTRCTTSASPPRSWLRDKGVELTRWTTSCSLPRAGVPCAAALGFGEPGAAENLDCLDLEGVPVGKTAPGDQHRALLGVLSRPWLGLLVSEGLWFIGEPLLQQVLASNASGCKPLTVSPSGNCNP